jgi:beta-1,2-mannobiose phosphorylase / 1,2-beta-oligomannan phosphorylase
MFVAKRSHHNPVLIPNRSRHWEATAAFNMSVVKRGRALYGIYRAISARDILQTPEQRSVIGIARSEDGAHFKNNAVFIEPREDWERFGCEDPRVTFFEGLYYIFYTALSKYPFTADGIKVAVAVSKDLKSIQERHPVTPFNAKAMTLFPERINGKVTVMLSAHTDDPPAKIAIAQADSITEFWKEAFWEKWHRRIDTHTIDPRRTEYDHVEVGSPPVKTKAGWLVVYSHIQNYFSTPERWERVFGIEALLLDLNDPTKIIGRTRGPIIVPEESYEKHGYVADVVFPSGALVEKDILAIYYGAADTTVCAVRMSLSDLLGSMASGMAGRYYAKRYAKNPVITPEETHAWESKATFNPAAIELQGAIHILYRALSGDNVSRIGYAVSDDGFTIAERLLEPVYAPREPFEKSKIAGNISGCEDPRLTKIGKRIYMYYTAFDGIGPPRVAVTSILEADFLRRKFIWDTPRLISPYEIDDKDACILPEKINGKYFVLHRIGTDICGDFIDTLDFSKHTIQKCIKILGPRGGTWDSAKVGITAPPIKTKKGWLLIYHAVSRNHHTYRVGMALLDAKDPTIVLSRSTDCILWPEEEYEKKGLVDNVVFPCGAIVRGNLLYMYYGGGDKVVCVATMEMKIILDALVRGAAL